MSRLSSNDRRIVMIIAVWSFMIPIGGAEFISTLKPEVQARIGYILNAIAIGLVIAFVLFLLWAIFYVRVYPHLRGFRSFPGYWNIEINGDEISIFNGEVLDQKIDFADCKRAKFLKCDLYNSFFDDTCVIVTKGGKIRVPYFFALKKEFSKRGIRFSEFELWD